MKKILNVLQRSSIWKGKVMEDVHHLKNGYQGLINTVNNFFIDLKATGQYSKISLMKLFLTDSTNNTTSLFQCGINAVNPTENVPTYFNAPIANYSGILYNGTTQYAIMNFNPTGDANWALTSATIMVYNGINVTGRMLGMRFCSWVISTKMCTRDESPGD